MDKNCLILRLLLREYKHFPWSDPDHTGIVVEACAAVGQKLVVGVVGPLAGDAAAHWWFEIS